MGKIVVGRGCSSARRLSRRSFLPLPFFPAAAEKGIEELLNSGRLAHPVLNSAALVGFGTDVGRRWLALLRAPRTSTIDRELANVATEWGQELDSRNLEGSAVLTEFKKALQQ